MNEVRNILEQLRKAKLTLLILLFVSFILFYYKSLITEVVEIKVKKEKDVIKEDITNNILIHQMLNDLMLRYESDRAYVFRFSNSIRFYDGVHKNHQSLTHEVCNKGISSEAMNLQNLPTSLYPMFLQEVMLHRMIYNDVNEIKENVTRITLKQQGIKSLIVAPVFNKGRFTAYVGVDFVKQKNDKKIDYIEFKHYTDEIGRMLSE